MKTESYLEEFLCDLTSTEVREKHEKMSAKVVELERLQAEKKVKMAHIGAEEKRLSDEIKLLGTETHNRKGKKAIEVYEVVGGPATISIVEKDSGIERDSRAMTDEELHDFRQGELFGQANWKGTVGATGRASRKNDDDSDKH